MEKKKCRIGFIGLGGRGSSMLGLLLQQENVDVPAICDSVPERIETGLQRVKDAGKEAKSYSDYKELLEKEDLDAVIIATTWITHIPIAIDAMNAGCHVGIEVGCASDLEECFELVSVSEKTGKFCMMLENCCYDRKEMAVFNMFKQGLFGEIVHCEGGYRHDLRSEIVLGRENKHGRLVNFMHRNGELYPTHELGPIAKLLDINRGNRFVSLVSMSSKARGLNEWIKKNKGEDYDLYGYDFKCGDVVTTMIKCANGETITLHHDCSLPRPYAREYTVEGTKACFKDAPDYTKGLIYIDGVSEGDAWQNYEETFKDKYEHPLWKKYTLEGIKSGHGGMDWLVLSAFVEAVLTDSEPPIDVYDTAAWFAITPLSEMSIAQGSAPVAVPDFTKGKWISREPERRSMYCLSEVCEELFENN